MVEEEIKVLLTAQATQLKTEFASAAKAATTLSTALSTELASAFKRGIGYAEEYTKAIFTSSVATGLLTQRLAELGVAAKAAAAVNTVGVGVKAIGTGANGAANAVNTLNNGVKGFNTNARTMYSLSALIADALTGQFGRSKREIAALASETGIMQRALGFLVSPMGAVTLGFITLAGAGLLYRHEMAKMEEAISHSAGMLHMTAQAFYDMAQSASNSVESVGKVGAGMETLAQSGEFSTQQFKIATSVMVEWATASGDSIKEVSKQMVAFGRDPVDALVKVAQAGAHVTTQQLEAVKVLRDQGDAYGALKQALTFARQDLENFNAKQTESVSGWQSFKQVLSQSWEEVKRVGDSFLTLLTDTGITKAAVVAFEAVVVVLVGALEALYAVVWAVTLPMRLFKELIDGIVNSFRALVGLAPSVDDSLNGITAATNANKDAAEADARAQENLIASLQKVAAEKSKDPAKTLDESDKEADSSYLKNLEAEYDDWTTIKKRTLSEEKAWWQDRLLGAKTSGADMVETVHKINSEINSITRQMHDQSASEAKKSASEILSQQRKFLAEEKADITRAAREEIRERAQADKEYKAIAKVGYDEDLNDQKTALDGKHALLRESYSEKIISAEQLHSKESDILDEELKDETAYYDKLRLLYQKDAIELARIAEQELRNKRQLNNERLKSDQQYVSNSIHEHLRLANTIASSTAQAVNGIIFQHQKLGQAIKQIAQNILSTWIETQVRNFVLSKTLSAADLAMVQGTEAAKTAAVIAGATARTGAEEAASSISLATQATTAIKWIGTEAAKAAAGAWAAMASIPYVGPALAVGASIAAFAGVMALVKNVSSAEGGWERVPFDNAPTLLHKDEMVLPADLSNKVRGMAGGGGGMTVHIHAMDARSFRDMMRRNPEALAAGVRQAVRTGNVR